VCWGDRHTYQGCQVPKNKKAKFGQKQFQKKAKFSNLQNVSNKFWKKLLILYKFGQNRPKRYNFLQDQKKAKNGQIATKKFFFGKLLQKGQIRTLALTYKKKQKDKDSEKNCGGA
jgi:hypothetical protein